MKRLFVALTAISMVLLFAGCGQSGPLYIPGNPSKIQPPPSAPDDAADEQDGEEEDESRRG